MKKYVLPIFLTALWISVSEFFRNEFLLKQYWTEHYVNLGLVFPAEPHNGALWGLWSLMLAVSLFFVQKRFRFWSAVGITWWMAFAMMWVVTGNLAVLPIPILYFAVPLSLLEIIIAAWIIKKVALDKVNP